MYCTAYQWFDWKSTAESGIQSSPKGTMVEVFTMVEDHLKQTQRLYEVIVRSAFLYEVPVRSALQRVALNDLYEVPVRRSQPRCESSLQ